MPVVGELSVFWGKGVALVAVRLGSVGRLECVPAQRVDTLRHCFEVLRVDAGAIATQVIDSEGI